MEKKINSSFSGRIELDGSECEMSFDTPYRCFEVLNEGDSDVVVSLRSGAADGDTGSVTIPAGRRVQYAHGRLDADTVYITGSGVVQVAGKNHMGQTFCPATASAGGGDGGYTSKEFSYTLPQVAYFPYIELELFFMRDGARNLEVYCNDTKIGDIVSTVDINRLKTETFSFPFETTESCTFKVVSSDSKPFEVIYAEIGYADNSSGYNMIISETNETIVTISGRTYTKVNAGNAICGYMYDQTGYTGPLMVSTDANAVTYAVGSTKFETASRLSYKGYSFYVCNFQYWMGGNDSDTSGKNRYKSTVTTDKTSGILNVLQKAYTAVTLDI